jgi:hypothetical protein
MAYLPTNVRANARRARLLVPHRAVLLGSPLTPDVSLSPLCVCCAVQAQELLSNICIMETAVTKLEEEMVSLHFQLIQERNERRLVEYRLKQVPPPACSCHSGKLELGVRNFFPHFQFLLNCNVLLGLLQIYGRVRFVQYGSGNSHTPDSFTSHFDASASFPAIQIELL